MRSCLVLLLAGACAHSGSGSSPAREHCTTLTPALQRQMTEAGEFTEEHFKAALAERQLTPVGLPQRQVGGWPDEGPPEGGPQHQPGTTFEENGKQWVAGPFISVPNGQLADPYFEFVKDAAGDVYQLERSPHVLSTGSVVLCGCGPSGSGAAPHLEQVIYELPAGAAFKGAVKVAYDVKLYGISYSGTDERGARCQPPP